MSDKNIKYIKIHPGIGLARMGNSEEYFIGPEAPGVVVDPGGHGGNGPKGGTYRDKQMKLKRQAQRYRVYGYDDNDEVVKEINMDIDDVVEIKWQVHARNMKSANYAFQGAYLFNPDQMRNPSIQPDKKPNDRDSLIIDPGVKVIGSSDKSKVSLLGNAFKGVTEGTLPGYLKFENFTPKDPSKDVNVSYKQADNIMLGELELDDKQRLLFIPSHGHAGSVTTPKVELGNPSEHFNSPNGPGDGKNALINQFAYFNVPGWWDDSCGGEIDVAIKLKDGSILSTRDDIDKKTLSGGKRNPNKGAWVITAPPKYSPYMYHVVSVLDRVIESFPDADVNKDKKTNFYRDVYPILSRACNYGWVGAEASGVEGAMKGAAHGPNQPGNLLREENLKAFADPSDVSKATRKRIFALMHRAEKSDQTSGKFPKLIDTLPENPPPHRAGPPRKAGDGPTMNSGLMPKLWGTGGKPLQNSQLGNNLPNQFLSLTDWQLKRMEDWSKGDFEPGILEDPKELEELPLKSRATALDYAALEPTIGGGFHPGIEIPYLVTYKEFFSDAFRVSDTVPPGYLASFMSSPWHGDYWSCNSAWWPVQRPDVVFEYDEAKQTRTYKEWFRGYDSVGKPLSSDDGYHQMVYAWDKLGMVLPKKDAKGNIVKANNQTVYQEYERDTQLNKKPS